MKKSAPSVLAFATIGEWLPAAGLPGPALFDDFHVVPRYAFSDQRQVAALPPFSKDFYEITLLREFRRVPAGLSEASPALCVVRPGSVFSPLREMPSMGFSAYFSDNFLSMTRAEIERQFPFFALGADPVLSLDVATFEDLQRTAQLALLENCRLTGAHTRSVLQTGLLFLLHKCRSMVEHHSKQPEVQPKAVLLTRRFQQLVQLNYLTHRSVADYARLLDVTPGHLNDSVKDTIGKNAGAIITAKVLEEAQKMLVFSNVDVAQIAQDLLFSNPSHFGKFFKKAMGVTPLEFRRKSYSAK